MLADAGNWQVGIPGLTYSLRGLAAADIELRALDGVAAVDVEEKGAEIDMIVEIELRGRNLTSLLGTLAGNGVAIKRFRQLDDEPFEVFSAATSLKTG